MQIADALVRYVADTKDLERELGPGGAVDKAGEKGASTVGSRFSDTFKRAGVAAGAAGGALFTSAVAGAASFEEQLRTINTVAKLTDDELAGVGDSILALSKETGKSTDDLTAGFYDLVSAGVPAKDAINVLRDSAVFATGALGTTGEAVDVVTSALNAYGLEATESGRVTDIFAQAVADGKVTAAELGSSIANIAPIAASAGISLEEVSTGFAVMTAKGTPAAQAATQMRAAISSLLTPNEQLNRLQEQTGINFAKLADEKGLAVALEELRKAAAANGDALAELSGVSGKDFPKALARLQDELGLSNSQVEKFSAIAGKDGAAKALTELTNEVGAGDSAYAKALGSVEAYQFALAATGENAAAFETELGKVTAASAEGGVAMGQYEEIQKSAAAQGRKLTATIKATAIEIGGPFVESFGPAITALGGMGQGLGGIFNLATGVGGALGGLAGKMLPILLGGLGSLVAPLTAAATGLGGAIAGAIPLGVVALPALLVAAIVGAIVVLANNPEIVDQVIAFAEGLVQTIVDFVGKLPEYLAPVIGALPGIIQEQIPKVVALLEKIGGRLVQLFVDLAGKIPGILATVGGAILAALPGFVSAVVDAILSIPGLLFELAPKVLEVFANVAATVLPAVLDLVGKVIGFILSIPSRLPELAPKVGAVFAAVGRVVIGHVARFLASAVGFLLSLPSKIAPLLGQVGAFFGRIAANVRATIATLAANVVSFVLSIPGRIVGLLGSLATFFGQVSTNVRNTFLTLVGNVVDFFLRLPGRIADVGGSIVRSIIGGMASLPGRLADTIRDAFRNLRIDVGPFHITGSGVTIDLPKIDLPSFDVGSSFVPRDMLAMVHQGEIIIPADEAAAIRSGRVNLGTPTFGSAAAVPVAGGNFTINVYAGDDVSEPAARRFGAIIRDEIAGALRDQRTRTTGTSGINV